MLSPSDDNDRSNDEACDIRKAASKEDELGKILLTASYIRPFFIKIQFFSQNFLKKSTY